MDIATLRTVGEELFGKRWQMPLARGIVRPGGAAGIDISLMQRWVAGERPLPAWIDGAILEVIMVERQRHLDHAARLDALQQSL
jgi:hypothetical protein